MSPNMPLHDDCSDVRDLTDRVWQNAHSANGEFNLHGISASRRHAGNWIVAI